MDGPQDHKAIEDALIEALKDVTSINSKTFADAKGYPHDQVVGVAMRLTAQSRIVMGKAIQTKSLVITEEGNLVLKLGSPEIRLYNLLKEDSFVEKSTLVEHFAGDAQALDRAVNTASRNKMLVVEKAGTKEVPVYNLKRLPGTFVDEGVKLKDWASLKETDPVMKEFVKRKWCQSTQIKTFPLEKGPKYADTVALCFPELTAELLESGEWEKKAFKPINYQALGLKNHGGFLHPLLKVRTAFRQIFLELGYEEMPTNRYVESSFWNFDSLFQPQQHPARDAHDTFFLANPEKSNTLPKDYLERVKAMHETGGHGSIGWRYKFSDEEPWKNVLRTHTTAISSQMLYALAQTKPFKPMKYFSIDRVFRNETIDATHLAEFCQIEGLIADYNISLISLMGAIKEFYARIGIQQLKFKPAYNPYTEPSMEIFGYHEGKKDWIEIGNSGIFRPEMLLPMGLPEGVGVAAWGLSLERPTMIMFGYQKITQLVGAKVDLKMIYNNPLVHFDNQ